MVFNHIGLYHALFGLLVGGAAAVALECGAGVAVGVGMVAAAVVACLTDRVPADSPFKYYLTFGWVEDPVPGTRVAVCAAPVALLAVWIGGFLGVFRLIRGEPVLTSPHFPALAGAAAVNVVLFLATGPVRAVAAGAVPPGHPPVAAERVGHSPCPDCGVARWWDGRCCGACGFEPPESAARGPEKPVPNQP